MHDPTYWVIGAAVILALLVWAACRRTVDPGQRARDRHGLGNACAACGRDGTRTDPLVLTDDGFRVHLSHTTDPASGLYGTRR